MSHPRPTRPLPACVIATLAMLGPMHALGQQEPAEPPSQSFTVEEIQAALDELLPLEEAEDLGDEDRTRLQLFRDALESARSADGAAELLAELDTQLARTPAEIQAVRAELARPPTSEAPQPEPDATRADLERELETVKTELETARSRLNEIEAELQDRDTRNTELRGRVAETQQRLQDLASRTAALPLPEDSPALTWARAARLAMEDRALEGELAVARRELEVREARAELTPLLRERFLRRVTQLTQRSSAWQTLVDDARAEDTRRQREEAARTAALAHPVVIPVAEGNVELAGRREALQPELEQAQQQLLAFRPEPDTLLTQFERLKLRVEIVGMTPTVGRMLRRARGDLPEVAVLKRRSAERRARMAGLEFEYLALEDDVEALVVGKEDMVRDHLATLDDDTPDFERTWIEMELRQQFDQRRSYLVGLESDLTVLFDRLDELNKKSQRVVELTNEMTAFIDKHILWMQSAEPLGTDDLREVVPAFQWLTSPDEWGRVATAAGEKLRGRWIWVAFAGVLLAGLFVARRRLLRQIKAIGSRLASPSDGTLVQFVTVTLFTVLRAAWWPAVLVVMSVVLTRASHAAGSALGQAVAEALYMLAAFLFVLMLAYETAQSKGLGESHFGWTPRSMRLVRREIRWLAIAVTVFGIPSAVANRNELFESSLGRLCSLVLMVVLSVFVYRLLNPASGVLRDVLARRSGSWATRLRYVWFPLTVVTPLAIAVMSGLGYQYTAARITSEVIDTAQFIVILVLVYYFALRWVDLGCRQLAAKQGRRLREAHEEALARGEEPGEPPPVRDISHMSAQALKLLRSGVLFTLLIGFFVIWSDSMPAIGFLERIELWESADIVATLPGPDGTPDATPVYGLVNLQDLLWSLLLVVVTFIVAANIPGLMEISVLQHLPLERGSQFAIARIVRYAITIVGMAIAFRYVGITWAKVQWLAAALTVGLGFGLNEIFGNFISGLIILFERPIRVGDTVTVGNITGTIHEIRIRATTLRDWDRKELVIPNKTFVIDTITNWTLSDPILRLVYPVQLVHEADTAAAEECLLRTARAHPHVLDDPAPSVMFRKVDEAGLEIDLRLFISHVDFLVAVKHEVYCGIVESFRKAGIRFFSMSHRDVDVRTAGGDPVPAGLSAPGETGDA